MASKTKLRRALKKAKSTISAMLPKDSEIKVLTRLDDLLNEEWDASTTVLNDMIRNRDIDTRDYGEIIGIRAMIKRVRDCINGTFGA